MEAKLSLMQVSGDPYPHTAHDYKNVPPDLALSYAAGLIDDTASSIHVEYNAGDSHQSSPIVLTIRCSGYRQLLFVRHITGCGTITAQELRSGGTMYRYVVAGRPARRLLQLTKKFLLVKGQTVSAVLASSMASVASGGRRNNPPDATPA